MIGCPPGKPLANPWSQKNPLRDERVFTITEFGDFNLAFLSLKLTADS
jgi:hypothetical protein